MGFPSTLGDRPTEPPNRCPGVATGPHALVYHAGGLGDFVLSIPALLRLAAASSRATWHYWGPRDRLALLPGWLPAPAEVLRGEACLWGGTPAPDAARWVSRAHRSAAFATKPPPWLPPAPRGLHLQAFPKDAVQPVEWVPRFQARQLDRAGVPRLPDPLLASWRERVLSERPGGRLVVHPGSGDPAKNLPLVTWQRAAEVLVQETGLVPLVLEGPVEQDRGLEETGWLAERVTCSTAGELLAVLGRTSLFLGNDSGVAHLAGALGVPTVAVFGPSDPARWRPLGPRVVVVTPPLACAPCCTEPPVPCAHGSCLAEIPASAVVEAARNLFGTDPGGRDQEPRPDRR